MSAAGLVLLATVFVGSAPVAQVAPAGAAVTPTYYLALGDSLSQGVQPNKEKVSLETNHGYVDDIYKLYRHQIAAFKLEKLGCPGETTTTMVDGGICTYTSGVTGGDPLGNQLAAAEAFLASNKVSFVTLDIGANDIDGCVGPSGIDETCLENGIAAVNTNLPLIVSGLEAADPGVPIYAMDYYDPFLFAWLLGQQTLAEESATLASGFDSDLDGIYAAYGVTVAPVGNAFQTTNFTPYPAPGDLPINVQLICDWTWMCSGRGPNIHATTAGYTEIADTFEQVIGFK